ncbi:head-tail connector protein [Alkalihalophilus lindianensis]|uniref:Head-tail connector protein n=1 Tax=Alkalihalophilus lindianensis TaxID=1630542 RepID=A0ABU3X7E1_9BACI|nr:head-tail connector protein [Alkalihalophilus lindianensis]MDV2683806.1 head-tail connector protein [Alkalihalophilus lindianensis]MDV2683872.1 head-tail connector protein [Alkalihalophilus lindianensis]
MEEVISSTLPFVKSHLRIDGTFEDEFLKSLIGSAVEETKDMGVPISLSDEYRYKLLIGMFVSHWYENRGQVQDGSHATTKDLPYGIQSLVLKMRVIPDESK